ncbi:hypothetical protein OUZ56_016017 [Daphnia magna]|uniref:Uncharacterized protein n=1 Tax=Daphnia magna TaxID=35525 RepID=A0ABR0APF3_9CRUS|nr:hypothetical protein OUZ56_016017 [Daphnia magna]
MSQHLSFVHTCPSVKSLVIEITYTLAGHSTGTPGNGKLVQTLHFATQNGTVLKADANHEGHSHLRNMSKSQVNLCQGHDENGNLPVTSQTPNQIKA